MRFGELLAIVGGEPLFDTGLLLVGGVDQLDIQRQLSRWVADGRVLQLRRGLYALAPPYRNVQPHPFLIANRLVPGSYVSLQSALEHHGLIPESVPVVTSVAAGRPATRTTPLGSFLYRHTQPSRLSGFRRVQVQPGQIADVATAAQALADLVTLVPGADSRSYLEELRLDLTQDVDLASPAWERTPKLRRALQHLLALQREARDSVVEVMR